MRFLNQSFCQTFFKKFVAHPGEAGVAKRQAARPEREAFERGVGEAHGFISKFDKNFAILFQHIISLAVNNTFVAINLAA